MSNKKKLKELIDKNPTHKKLIDNTNKINEIAMKVSSAIKNSHPKQ